MNATYIKDMSNAQLLTILCGEAGAELAHHSLVKLFGYSAKPQQENFGRVMETRMPYNAHPQLEAAKELIARAMVEEMKDISVSFTNPEIVKNFVCTKIGSLENEVFWALWMDPLNRLICAEQLFNGSLTQTSVYPRPVVQRALQVNAAAVIFAHNHPSGGIEPSRADEMITQRLKASLDLVDVRVLDHFVVSGNQATSFAQKGLL